MKSSIFTGVAKFAFLSFLAMGSTTAQQGQGQGPPPTDTTTTTTGTCDTTVYHISPQGQCSICPDFCPPECDPNQTAYKIYTDANCGGEATSTGTATATTTTETTTTEATTSTSTSPIGTVTEITSFSIPKSPSGMFFDEIESGLLYILCGTNTNGDHYIYTYTTDGEQRCLITIPQSVGMSRVDGFYITHEDNKAYIVDSQGPIYASQGDGYLGGSVYEVEWTNPCGCSSDGTCTSTDVSWTPTVTQSWSLSASDVSTSEGGGNDEYFRNSGIVVVGDTWFGVNGVHPVDGSYTSAYTKSIVQMDMATSTVLKSWSFDGSILGHDVDMEGLTCGADECSTTLYVGDEYNYIYELDLETGDVTMEWDLGPLVGDVPVDKGIESLTYAPTTGYFYAGIQQTAEIHVVSLSAETPPSSTTTTNSSPPTTLSECAPTEDFPKCAAPTITAKRVRREVRSLSTEEWNKVVAAMWIMKTGESMESGKTKYGDSFRTYDYFVVKHAVATTDARGDAAHFGAHFIAYHSAIVLEFENALLAIDPTIEAMPYWDETISSPSAFSEDYFGIDPSSQGSTTYEVTTGKFANWPISQTFSIDDWSAYIPDLSAVIFNGGMESSNILRGGENKITATYETRYGSGSDWEATAPSIDDWWTCASDDVADWTAWYSCIEQGRPSFHSGPHASIGGIIRDETGVRGDFEDPITSPNAPIFMFHHASLTRNLNFWMRKHNQEDSVCQYYGFPVEDAPYIGVGRDNGENGAFEGAHLNDVLSGNWGFTAQDLGLDPTATSVATGRAASEDDFLTNADIVCWLNPEAASYTYDTNIDCLLDNAKCNSVQGAAAMPEGVTITDLASTASLEDSSSAPSVSSSRLLVAVLLLPVIYLF